MKVNIDFRTSVLCFKPFSKWANSQESEQTLQSHCKKCCANTFLGVPLLNNGQECKDAALERLLLRGQRSSRCVYCAIPPQIRGWEIWHQCDSEIDPMSPALPGEDPTIRTGKARPHSSGKGRGGQRISTTDRDFRFFPMPWLDKSFKSFTCHPPISLPCIDTDHVARNDCFHFKLSLIRKASRMIILCQYQTQI